MIILRSGGRRDDEKEDEGQSKEWNGGRSDSGCHGDRREREKSTEREEREERESGF